jgi:hypothetical protein
LNPSVAKEIFLSNNGSSLSFLDCDERVDSNISVIDLFERLGI